MYSVESIDNVVEIGYKNTSYKNNWATGIGSSGPKSSTTIRSFRCENNRSIRIDLPVLTRFFYPSLTNTNQISKWVFVELPLSHITRFPARPESNSR